MPVADAEDPLWYKDAVIYEVHVRAFGDSDGDGVGDFPGLTARLDYLQQLGVTAIWLLPFYPSPLRDDGYDIADYANVNPAYGTRRDFKVFLREAHRRGLRVITELVLNHTSDQHPWFQRARRAKPGSRWRNYYVWSDTYDRYTEARVIFEDYEASNWTWDPVAGAYYWHRFFSHQPDLNFDNPEVRDTMLRAVDQWLEMGVDGVRLDAVPYLFERDGTNCENLPETHAFLRELRAHVDTNFPGRMLLAEANQWPEDSAAYFGDGDECHFSGLSGVSERAIGSREAGLGAGDGDGGHIEGFADSASAAADMPGAAELSAINIERGEASQGGDSLGRPGAEFRHQGQQGRRADRADTRH